MAFSDCLKKSVKTQNKEVIKIKGTEVHHRVTVWDIKDIEKLRLFREKRAHDLSLCTWLTNISCGEWSTIVLLTWQKYIHSKETL